MCEDEELQLERNTYEAHESMGVSKPTTEKGSAEVETEPGSPEFRVTGAGSSAVGDRAVESDDTVQRQESYVLHAELGRSRGEATKICPTIRER